MITKPCASCFSISNLMPLSQVSLQSLFNMTPNLLECFTTVANMKVAYPTSQGGVDLSNHSV